MHSLTHAQTHALTYSRTNSCTRLLTHPLTSLFTHSLTHLFTDTSICSHAHTQTRTHSLKPPSSLTVLGLIVPGASTGERDDGGGRDAGDSGGGCTVLGVLLEWLPGGSLRAVLRTVRPQSSEAGVQTDDDADVGSCWVGRG